MVDHWEYHSLFKEVEPVFKVEGISTKEANFSLWIQDEELECSRCGSVPSEPYFNFRKIGSFPFDGIYEHVKIHRNKLTLQRTLLGGWAGFSELEMDHIKLKIGEDLEKFDSFIYADKAIWKRFHERMPGEFTRRKRVWWKRLLIPFVR